MKKKNLTTKKKKKKKENQYRKYSNKHTLLFTRIKNKTNRQNRDTKNPAWRINNFQTGECERDRGLESREVVMKCKKKL